MKPTSPHQDLEPSLESNGKKERATSERGRAPLSHMVFMCMLLLLPAFAHAGFFNAIFGFIAEAESEGPQEIVLSNNAQTVPLLRAVINADPTAAQGGGDIIVDGDGTLIPGLGPAGLSGGGVKGTGEISIYVVKEADDLGHIAEMFDVDVNTILWANSKESTIIRPGEELLILPISGVRHVVKQGDTLKAIVKKYHPEAKSEDLESITAEIIDYNRLADASDIVPGNTLVIPGGEIVAPKPTAKPGKKGGVAASGAGGNSSLINPLPGSVRTQGIHGYNGVDLGAGIGTPIRAAAAGTVILVRGGGAWNGGYGNYIVVKHGNGTQTLYAHNSRNAVSIGQYVEQGETIGYVGNTGRSTGAHLHFEVRGGKNPF